jgi:hypothetical protein
LNLLLSRSQGSSVSVVTKLRCGWQGLDSRQGHGYFSFTIAFRPALGPHPSLLPKSWPPNLHLVPTLRKCEAILPGARIAQRYSAGLQAGWSGVQIPAGVGNFSLHHRIQAGSGSHPAYPMGTRGSSPGGKAAGARSWPLTS